MSIYITQLQYNPDKQRATQFSCQTECMRTLYIKFWSKGKSNEFFTSIVTLNPGYSDNVLTLSLLDVETYIYVFIKKLSV